MSVPVRSREAPSASLEGADRHVSPTPQWAVATIDAYLDVTRKAT